MELRELDIKNFGKLSGKKLEFAKGINVVYGENESGKSTVHTFIKSMLFGMERGRGRAAASDTFSRYEPWENPNYYSGGLNFVSGGKTFRIERNFDKYAKNVTLTCLDDGEILSVDDGDLDMLLSGLTASGYDNTISIRQLEAKPGDSLAAELKNYATNYYSTGGGELDLNQALLHLKNDGKEAEKQIKKLLEEKQKEREHLEQEASYIWREVHELQGKEESLREEIAYREEKEARQKEQKQETHHGIMDELRPENWRIHPMELVLFLVIIICPNFVLPKPLSYLLSIILFLAFGLYVWNRMKVGKRQEKTPQELLLEEILPETDKVSLEKLRWELQHESEERKDKEVQYGNLQERLGELDELGEEYKSFEKKKRASEYAIQKLSALSENMEQKIRGSIDDRMSEILKEITGGKYLRVATNDSVGISLLEDGHVVKLEQVSRGTIEQVYFALRMAADDMLRDENFPVILDDTFVYYDDERLKRTLEWIGQNKKQVIIFTCQKREVMMLNKLGVPYHLVEL